jgi:hypothetical protein
MEYLLRKFEKLNVYRYFLSKVIQFHTQMSQRDGQSRLETLAV